MVANQRANGLQPLCFEHHTEMRLVPAVSGNGAHPGQEPKYACQESDCLVCFTTRDGYFLAPSETALVEEEILPSVQCPHDGAPMYLGEVRPEESSFRQWRCPRCSAASSNNHAPATAD